MQLNTEMLLIFLSALPAALLLTLLLCCMVIPVLRSRNIGQHIFSDYVSEHRGKEGTPTMGGICFILPTLLLLVPYVVTHWIRADRDLVPLALTVCLGVANAMIGFFDDYKKLSHNENMGLRSWQKMLLQIAVAALYLGAMAAFGGMDTVVDIRVLHISFDMGVFYYVAALIVIVGLVNSTNLTDGIDGLASSVALVAFMGISILSVLFKDSSSLLLSSLMIGAMIGFLVFNYHPAKVFMGDTGSLFLGGILIGTGFMMDEPLILLIMCAVFVLDMLSSLIQIISIRVFHRKVFRIAPVHHQFQQMSWSEEKIVYIFSGVGLLFCALAVLIAWYGL
ncbi:MAG: phospho-N-acetylmuramoyl-pentapeptide-transferase [Clostridia bacterium]|nr:phospho-N-acetylmuramoyl-pentapeptide-transferase [Clostridia bacterium]